MTSHASHIIPRMQQVFATLKPTYQQNIFLTVFKSRSNGLKSRKCLAITIGNGTLISIGTFSAHNEALLIECLLLAFRELLKCLPRSNWQLNIISSNNVWKNFDTSIEGQRKCAKH